MSFFFSLSKEIVWDLLGWKCLYFVYRWVNFFFYVGFFCGCFFFNDRGSEFENLDFYCMIISWEIKFYIVFDCRIIVGYLGFFFDSFVRRIVFWIFLKSFYDVYNFDWVNWICLKLKWIYFMFFSKYFIFCYVVESCKLWSLYFLLNEYTKKE